MTPGKFWLQSLNNFKKERGFPSTNYFPPLANNFSKKLYTLQGFIILGGSKIKLN